MKQMFEGWSLVRARLELEKAKYNQTKRGCGNMLYRQALAKYIRAVELGDKTDGTRNMFGLL